MTAKEYLISVLNDPQVKYSSVQTRIALCAYAIRINKEVEGYSLNNLEDLIKKCKYDRDFINNCTSFVSHVNEAYQYIPQIPTLED